MRNTAAILFLVFTAGFAFAADGGLAWYDGAYPGEFRFIQESGYDKTTWDALAPDEKSQKLEEAGPGAKERLSDVRAYYSEMTAKWPLAEVDAKLAELDAEGIASVRLWLGQEHSAYLENKLERVGAMRESYKAGSLKEAEVAAAAPYLSADAASQLKALPKAGAGAEQAAAQNAKRQGENAKKMDGVKGSYAASTERSGSGKKFFDGAGQSEESVEEPGVKLDAGPGTDARKIDSAYYRGSNAKTVAGGTVPELGGAAPVASHKQEAFNSADLKRMDSVVADMKQKRQAAGSENGWLGNFKQSVGLSKADSGCSGWADATVNAIKNDPVLSQKYEAGYVRGLRNPLGAVTKWPPSSPLPLPHFVAVVWPKGTDPNDTAIYVDSWAKETKRGPIRDYTYEYSFDPKDMTPTVYYNREVKKEVKLANGKTRLTTEMVETPVPLIKANPWIIQ